MSKKAFDPIKPKKNYSISNPTFIQGKQIIYINSGHSEQSTYTKKGNNVKITGLLIMHHDR